MIFYQLLFGVADKEIISFRAMMLNMFFFLWVGGDIGKVRRWLQLPVPSKVLNMSLVDCFDAISQ